MRRALAVLGLVMAAASCGDPNGTSLFVTVAWQDGWPITQLQFSGQQGGSDAFPTSQRGDAGMGVLGSPQSVLIQLKEALAGTHVGVTVLGLVADGGTYASAQDFADPVLGRDVLLHLELVTRSAGGGDGAGGGSATGG